MKRRRCLVLVGWMGVACGLRANAGATEPVDPDPARFEAEIGAFAAWDRQNAYPRSGLLFVGSSSIRMWQTAESFPRLPVINRGFGGAHVSDVNHFVDRIVLKYQPRAIVFYAGDNDIAEGKSASRVAGDFRQFVDRVWRGLPETQVIYLPIKPSLARWDKWPEMSAANAFVKECVRSDKRLSYVDTATPMLSESGRPRPELFIDDGLHMNAEGYRLWTKSLRPVVTEMLAERAGE